MEPLAQSFAAGTQVVFVPEYSRVTVTDAGVITAAPWNGRFGGVVAFLASELLVNDGVVSVRGAGFRGGRGNVPTTCPSDARAPAGEGLWRSAQAPELWRYPETGTGGEGSADCPNASRLQSTGGGGAGLAPGRTGRARGGLAVSAPLDRLLFGGGGGAGFDNSLGSPPPVTSLGGSGGGAIFVRARRIEGTGSFDARGSASPRNAGAGGGGTVEVLAAESVDCALATADGADTVHSGTTSYQPPEPGGGGRVVLRGSSVECYATAWGGANSGAYRNDDPFDPLYRGEVLVIETPLHTDAGGPDAGVGDGDSDGRLVPRVLTVGCGCIASPRRTSAPGNAQEPPSSLTAGVISAGLVVFALVSTKRGGRGGARAPARHS